MKFIEFFGITFTMFSVILGAFGAHSLRKSLSESELQSFEVGVRYMMYHGLALLIFSQIPLARNPWIFRLFFWGVILFCGSIFLLCLGKLSPYDFSWMGPITPIGGGLLIIGWALLLWKAYQNNF